MQLVFIVNVDTTANEYDVASVIEDSLNSFYAANDEHDIDRVVVEKVFLTKPNSLAKVDEATASRIYT